MPASSQLLLHAIQLYRKNDAPGATRILAGLLLQEPEQATAWAWFCHICADDRARFAALEAAYCAHPQRAEIRQNFFHLRARLTLSQPETGAASRSRSQPAARAGRIPALLLISLGVLLAALAWVAWQTGKQASYILEVERLTAERDTLRDHYGSVSAELASSNSQLRQLQYDFQVLSNQQGDLAERFDRLQGDYDHVLTEYTALQRRYSGLNDQYLDLEHNSIRPPYIIIAGREVDMAFKRLDESILHWKVSFDVLEANIERGQSSRDHMFNFFGKLDNSYALDMPASSGSFRVVDYRKFVDPGPFGQVMKSVYSQAPDEETFLRETWNIMAQLTTYAFDPQRETPRYPLETLLAGGGDCEDTSILFASLVKAAPVNWKISFVYMDSDHPDKLVEPNHLAVAVDTGSREFVIETTSKSEMTPYPSPPDGWYLELR